MSLFQDITDCGLDARLDKDNSFLESSSKNKIMVIISSWTVSLMPSLYCFSGEYLLFTHSAGFTLLLFLYFFKD